MTEEMNELCTYYDKEGILHKVILCPLSNFYCDLVTGKCITCQYNKPKERVLNPEIADFFWATCERFKKCGKQ